MTNEMLEELLKEEIAEAMILFTSLSGLVVEGLDIIPLVINDDPAEIFDVDIKLKIKGRD